MSLCFSCNNLTQCPYLMGPLGLLDKGKVRDDCSYWSPCSKPQLETRNILTNLLDESEVLRQVFEGRLKFEGEDVEHVDFKAMLRQDITLVEREHQLRYETDKEGNVLSDNVCEKRPRSALTLRKYAHELGLTHGQSVGMTIEQIIKFILSTEINLGHLAKERKPKKGPELAQEESKMAEGRRIMLPRKREASTEVPVNTEPAKGPEVAGRTMTGKIGRPPSRPKAEAPANVQVNEDRGPERVQAPVAGGHDMANELAKFLLPEIQVRVAEVLEAKLAETVNRIVASMTGELQKAVESLSNSANQESEKVLYGITALHDLMAANGLIQWVDPDSNEKSPLELLLPENKTVMIYVPE